MDDLGGSMSKEVLNAKRLLCPLPVIRTQDKVKTMATGDILQVVCTDPGSCKISRHGAELMDIK